MRSFDTSGLFCCGRKRGFLCLNLSVSGRTLALGLGLGLGLVVPEVARAACVATPDCDSLGYTETSCSGGGVKCPWDTSKMFCGCGAAYVYSCTGTGYSGGVGSPCGGKYASCTCASGYDWNGSSCIVCDSAYKYTCTGTYESAGVGSPCGSKYTSCTCDAGFEWSGSACGKICAVGDILNSDMTCTSDLVGGRTPIGVVSYINGSTRIAIQLDSPGGMAWSSDYVNIAGITNYRSSPHTTDFSGKSNTQAWVDYWGSSATSYAAGYCNSYSKGGVSGWYLPAAGELYASVWTNKTAVNAGLSKAGGTAIVEDWHWSSSEYEDITTYYAWVVRASNGGVSYDFKDYSYYVRCVLAF